MRPIVIVESPYACGHVDCDRIACIRARKLEAYARAAVRDCIIRGEAPFASHLLYTQPGVLRDGVDDERELGIDVGFSFRAVAEKTVVYQDMGMSKGMQLGVEDAMQTSKHIVEYRHLPGWKP